MLSDELARLEEALSGLCAGLDPDSVAAPDVPRLWRRLDRIERLAAGAKLRLARRLEDAHLGAGVRSTEEWMASAAGSTIGDAKGALAASKQLADLPDADAAVAAGRLSPAQARPIADAATADPDAEVGLVGAAALVPVRELRERCQRTKANADPDAAARRERIRRSRYARSWTDGEGAGHFHLRHLPEVVAEIDALLAPFTHARFEAARTAGDHEAREAYAADAVLDLARATATTAGDGDGVARPKGASRAATKVLVHIDARTLLERRALPGSTCHIAGVGPVDPAWVASILGEAFCALLVEDGEDVRTVAHAGRQVTARQRSALEARGYRCSVPGCGAASHLEIHHTAGGYTTTRRTTLAELAWLCPHHHDQQTHHGWNLEGTHPHWTWHPPPPAADVDAA